MRSPIPILLLKTLNGLECDLSCDNLVVLHNSLLVRTYAELSPDLTALAIVTKRWAKSRNVLGAQRSFLSSYAWTLMIIYYLQVCHGLPSLHQLAPTDPEHSRVLSLATSFADLDTARAAMAAGGRVGSAGQTPDGGGGGFGERLRGFFRFYATQFGWADEVVSVRLGRRGWAALDAGPESLFGLMKPGSVSSLNIEDPIECSKNHNKPLNEHSLNKLRREVCLANQLLEAGGGLRELFGGDVGGLSGSAEEDLQTLTVDQLKDRLRKAGLSVSGLKDTLVARLLDCEFAKERQAWMNSFLNISWHVPPLLCRCHGCGALLDHATLSQHLTKKSMCPCYGGPARDETWGCAGCAAFYASEAALEEHQRSAHHRGRIEPHQVLDSEGEDSFFQQRWREHLERQERLRQLAPPAQRPPAMSPPAQSPPAPSPPLLLKKLPPPPAAPRTRPTPPRPPAPSPPLLLKKLPPLSAAPRTLVNRVKRMQSRDPDAREQWSALCVKHGGGVRDPARHDASFLQSFIARYHNGKKGTA